MVQSAGESLDLGSLEVVSLNQALLLGGPFVGIQYMLKMTFLIFE